MALALWCAATWRLSAESDPQRLVGVRVELPDKLVHGIEYAAGGFLACGALGGRRRTAWAGAVVFCWLWGVLDEVHQGFVPRREPDGMDVAADVAGASVGAASLVLGRGRRQPPRLEDDEHPGAQS